MTANNPLKTPPEGDDGPDSTVKDTRDFMKNLDEELKDFDNQLETLKESRSMHSAQEPPHFTVDSSPTRNM